MDAFEFAILQPERAALKLPPMLGNKNKEKQIQPGAPPARSIKFREEFVHLIIIFFCEFQQLPFSHEKGDKRIISDRFILQPSRKSFGYLLPYYLH